MFKNRDHLPVISHSWTWRKTYGSQIRGSFSPSFTIFFTNYMCTIVHDSSLIYFKILSYANVHLAFLSLVDYNNSSSYISKKKRQQATLGLMTRFKLETLSKKQPNFLMYIHHMYQQHESVRIIYKKCVGSSKLLDIKFFFHFRRSKKWLR